MNLSVIDDFIHEFMNPVFNLKSALHWHFKLSSDANKQIKPPIQYLAFMFKSQIPLLQTKQMNTKSHKNRHAINPLFEISKT